ncbi:hypothetical protein C5167_047388 [Papaver somniferum]|uniref:Uncharacterized protein n=1 Tax=Papaver somniferum TaxID=3469 RepID=A0A4Y7LH86_PAPSO|nr:hypothetical protein C5167_047388 [Papaver somniferum]
MSIMFSSLLMDTTLVQEERDAGLAHKEAVYSPT